MKEKIKELLLTWEEYSQIRFEVPYVYEIEKGNKVLFYFGSRHTNDKNHQQFVEFKKLWKKFLDNKNENKIVFVEGGHGEDKYNSEDESIEKHGEAGLATYLSNKENIEIISPEVDSKYIYQELNKKYSEDEILYHRVANVLLQWNRQVEKPDVKEYLERFSVGDYERIQKIHKDLFNKELNPDDNDHFYNHVAPNEYNSVINEISREESLHRDTFITENILNYWNKEYSIFIVFGSGHALVQEKAIKELCK